MSFVLLSKGIPPVPAWRLQVPLIGIQRISLHFSPLLLLLLLLLFRKHLAFEKNLSQSHLHVTKGEKFQPARSFSVTFASQAPATSYQEPKAAGRKSIGKVSSRTVPWQKQINITRTCILSNVTYVMILTPSAWRLHQILPACLGHDGAADRVDGCYYSMMEKVLFIALATFEKHPSQVRIEY